MLTTLLGVLAVLAILFVAAVVATRGGDILAEAPPDEPDLDLPPGMLQPEDVTRVRFSMALRGYRMREVDEVLARLAAELADRDSRMLALEQALVHVVEPQAEEAAGQASALLEPVDLSDTAPAVRHDAGPEGTAADQTQPPIPAVADSPLPDTPALGVTAGALTAVAPPAESVPVEPQVEPVAAEPAAAQPEPGGSHEAVASEAVPAPAGQEPDEAPRWPQPDLEPEPESLLLPGGSPEEDQDAFPQVQPPASDRPDGERGGTG